MGAVVTAAVDCPKVRRVVDAATPPLDEVVSGISPWLAADVADAPVADDHRGGKLPPGLSAVCTVEGISTHPLRPLPTGRAMDGRLPGQWDGPEMMAPRKASAGLSP